MLRVRVLGDLTVELDGTAAALPSSAKVRAVLAWLALHPGMQPRSSSPRGSGRTSSTRAPAPACAARSGRCGARSATSDGRLLVATRDQVGLGGPGVDVWVDLLEFERLARAGGPEEALALDGGGRAARRASTRNGSTPRATSTATAAWPRSPPRARRPRRAATSRRRSRYDRRRAQLDPLSEPAHRDLIRRLDAAGDRGAALAAYAKLRDRMRRDLALSPSPATRAAVEAVRASAAADEHAAASAAARDGGAADAVRARPARRPAPDARRRRRRRASASRAPPDRRSRRTRQRSTTVADRVRSLPPLAGRRDEWAVARQRLGARGNRRAAAPSCWTARAGSARRGSRSSCSPHAERDGAAVAGCAALELGGRRPVRALGGAARRAGAGPRAGGARRRAVWPEDVARLAPAVARRLRSAVRRGRRARRARRLAGVRARAAVRGRRGDARLGAAAAPARAAGGGHPPRRRGEPRAGRLRRAPAARAARCCSSSRAATRRGGPRPTCCATRSRARGALHAELELGAARGARARARSSARSRRSRTTRSAAWSRRARATRCSPSRPPAPSAAGSARAAVGAARARARRDRPPRARRPRGRPSSPRSPVAS